MIIQNSMVLFNWVEEVCKLVIVEGYFSELYDEMNIWCFMVYVLMLSMFFFFKKVIFQVEGKVLVGYDLKNIKIIVDSMQKWVVFSYILELEIFLVDYIIVYKNLFESFFNSFVLEDYIWLNVNVKVMFREKVKGSDFMQEVCLEGNQLICIMDFIVCLVGWLFFIQIFGFNVFLLVDSFFI